MLGDDLDRVERKLDEARREFFEETPDDADAEHELNKHYGPALLALQTAICYEMAGQFVRAVDTYRSALAKEAFSYRDHGYFLSLMAGALAAAGEPDEAATVGMEGLFVAVATHSTRTTSELVRLRDQLESWPQRPAVRDFREALSLV